MHKATQQRFFELITTQSPLYKPQGNPINTYRELIHYRFKEVLLNAYPRFSRYLSEEAFETLVWDFIKGEPQTPYIWQMPDEFRHFVATTELPKSYPFINDLLWFEWIEIELFMKHYQPKKQQTFSWDKAVCLSESAVLKKLNFPVFHDEGLDQSGIYAVLVYYDFATHEIHYRQITPFLHELLERFSEKTPKEALAEICSHYEVEPDEVIQLLQEPLQSFAAQQIIITKEV